MSKKLKSQVEQRGDVAAIRTALKKDLGEDGELGTENFRTPHC